MNEGTCLLCFAVNRRTLDIINTHLQEVYEQLAGFKIHNASHSLCFICHTRLQQCHQLCQLVKQTQTVFESFQENSYKLINKLETQKSLVELSTANVVNISILFNNKVIKQETDVKNEDHYVKDDTELDELENNDDFEKREESIKSSDSEDDVPLNDILTDTELDVLENNDDLEKREESIKSSDSEDDVPLNDIRLNQELQTGEGTMTEVENIKIEAQEIMLSEEEQMSEFLQRAKTDNYIYSPYKCDMSYRGFFNPAAYEKHDEMDSKFAKNKSIDDPCISALEFVSTSYNDDGNLQADREPEVKERDHLKQEDTTEELDCKKENPPNPKSNSDQDVPLKIMSKEEEKKTKCVAAEDNSKEVKETTDAEKLKTDINNIINEIKSKELLTKYTCDLCPYEASRESTIWNHRLIHANNSGIKFYVCSYCPYVNKWKTNVMLHEMSHTGIKPYSCEVCTRTFASSSDFKRHKRIHTGEKPYSCVICQRTFSNTSHLNRHKRIHTGEKAYGCDICDRKFAAESNLKRHERTHTGDKPFSCIICKRKFSDNSHLNRHKKTHTGYKPFSCNYCQREFTESNTLKRHERIHTGDKPYSCDICNKEFTQSSNLRRHKTICMYKKLAKPKVEDQTE